MYSQAYSGDISLSFHQRLKQKRARCPKDEDEGDNHAHPRAELLKRGAIHVARGDNDRRDDQRQNKREQQNGQKDLAGAGASGHGGNQRAGPAIPNGAQRNREQHAGLDEALIEQDSHHREDEQTHREGEHQICQRLADEHSHAVARREHERVKTAVKLLGEHGTRKPQRARKHQRDPQNARHQRFERIHAQAQRKVEHHHRHDGKHQHGRERLAGANFYQQVFAEDGEGDGENAAHDL